MNDSFIKLIKERRSIRDFEETKIDKKLIKKIIQAGKYAPSATNSQPWKFIVITNKEYIQDISLETKKGLKKILKWRYIIKFFIKEFKNIEFLQSLFFIASSKQDLIFYNAPVLILILSEKKRFYNESCACCAENMMLSAHSLGIGSCWIGYTSIIGLNKKTIKKIGIPKKHHISSALIFGYPKGKSKKASIRKIGSDIIKWIE